ncbi:MAG: glycogen debranching enzyme N-terminal domain-containing protein [Planctomycetota bacterium]|nr:glycogen debranching enzyme N-terminal domain-containing protein [Planctomycetota bacterium]
MPVPPMTHTLPIASNPLALLEREWVLTNGTGAFAMGTVPGVNTRRYHALLVASARPPVARFAALNQVLEQVVIGGQPKPLRLEFTTCQFRGLDAQVPRVFAPKGCSTLTRFERGVRVAWTHRVAKIEGIPGQIEFRRELALHWKQQAATLRYRVRFTPAAGQAALPSLTLRLGPLTSLRDYHQVQLQSRDGAPSAQHGADSVTLKRGDLAVTLRSPGSRFGPAPEWWYKAYYEIEDHRGLDCEEDYFLPGWFEVPLDPARGGEAALTVALGEQPAPPLPDEDDTRLRRLAPVIDRLSALTSPAPTAAAPPAGMPADLPTILALAADDFVVDRWIKETKLATIIAGYPWFTDWGRDTFIALPGLLLTTGRYDEARSVLRAFAAVVRDGLVPNVFDDKDASAGQYNTVDGSLWFVHAAMEYVRVSGDREAWTQWLGEACQLIVEAYIRGTTPPELAHIAKQEGAALIRMTGDGLVTAGTPATQLTWMDAACNGVVFTARPGKAVEINALWFHVLSGMSEMLAETNRNSADHYQKLGARIGRSFSKIFWNDQLGYLHDHAWTDPSGQEHIDASLRPNQLLAVSLAHSPLPRKRQQQVIDAVRQRLLTPLGIRTLPTDDAKFHPHYGGPPMSRDEAYHQGTVWPWLIGPYAEGLLRVGRFSDASRAEARQAIDGLLQWMLGPGLGQVPEIAEGASPHRPDGCVAQAWSVAELLRVLDLIAHPPKA